MKRTTCRHNGQSAKNKLIIPLLLLTLLLLSVGVAQASALKLPASLKVIEEEAFMNDKTLDSVTLPEGIESIGERAFANCSMVDIYLPKSLKSIADTAFENHSEAFIIKGYKGSVAETFANKHDILFVPMDDGPEVIVTESWDEFSSVSSTMIQQYSSAVSISSSDASYSTGRLIVKTDANLPDVSAFHVSEIIRDPDNHYFLQFTSDQEAIDCMNYLKGFTDIIYVEPDIPVIQKDGMSIQATSYQANSWGVSATYADAYAADLKARGLTSRMVVAVVDSGVDSSHPMLSGRMLSGYDFVQGDRTPQDEKGHGTHVAGTIVDCTPGLNVMIMPVRVLNAEGRGSDSVVANGIRYAAANGARVINLSLGGNHSNYLDEYIKYALGRGAIVVVAAGNESANTARFCPAHIAGCITVSAVDSNKQKAKFSNYGSAVDVAAPGVNIKSSVPGGKYESWNGTSMAAPHVSAAAAMLLLDNYSNIESQLRNHAEDIGSAGKDEYYGSGFLCLRAFIKNQKEYTITYNANGGSGAPDSQKKTSGDSISLSSVRPTRLHTVSFNDNFGNTSIKNYNFEFQKWNTKADGSGNSYAAGASYPEDASVTLYAQWNTVTAESLPQPTREGYTFVGWFTAATGGSKISEKTAITGDTTYYAHWTQNTFAVSYNANGGSGAPSNQAKKYGTALTLSTAKPTRSHTVTFNADGKTSTKTVSATFVNWNTAANGSGTSYAAGASYTANAPLTLYAQWTYGTVGSLSTPVKEGFIFLGWYTAQSGGTKISSSTTVSSNVTFYAHWEAEKWGAWSEWSDTAVKADSKTKVEEKTVYRYRDTTETTEYNDWSDWGWPTFTRQTITDPNLMEEQYVKVYIWYFFTCPNCGWHSPYWGYSICANCGGDIPNTDTYGVWWLDLERNGPGTYNYNSAKRAVQKGNELAYYNDEDNAKYTNYGYKYRTRTTYQKKVVGDWTAYQDASPQQLSNREIESKKMYRYCKKLN